MAWTPLNAIPIQLQDGTTSVNMESGSLEFYLAGTTTPTNLASDNTGTSIGSSITLNSAGYPESGGNVITLFRDTTVNLKIVGKNAAGTTIWTADGLKDALVILASTSNGDGASLIAIEDSAGYFTGTDVEAALADIGGNYAKLSSNEIVTGSWTVQGSVTYTDQVVARPVLRDYAIDHNSASSSSGTLELNCNTGNSWAVTLTENVTTFSILNPAASGSYCELVVYFTQGAGAYTVAQPSGTINPGGTNWTMSTGSGDVDRVVLSTIDGGSTWHLDYSQAYS